VAHPRTALVDGDVELPELVPPFVVKPRFGTRGRHVSLLADRRALAHHLRSVAREPWFRRQGVLVQELVPAESDLRLVVAGDDVVAAARRRARPGDWRTNAAHGAWLPAAAPSAARVVALAAARASGADLVGVDLLRRADGGYTVLELDAAVELAPAGSLGDTDVFARVAAWLERQVPAVPMESGIARNGGTHGWRRTGSGPIVTDEMEVR
jgi:glutathione synthase/RimK-type ligase-like ATP-grasp enzyme